MIYPRIVIPEIVFPVLNYDNCLIAVDPDGLYLMAEMLPIYVQEVGDAVNAISQTLSNLTLSWVGQSASDAAEFQTDWAYAAQALFGTGIPGTGAYGEGVLNLLASIVGLATENYSQTDQAVATNANSFMNGALQPSQPSPYPNNNKPLTNIDPNTGVAPTPANEVTSINETF